MNLGFIGTGKITSSVITGIFKSKLKNSKICVVGVGGLGNPITSRLVAMGVGTLRIIDRDVIELSNLHRQTMYDESDVGQIKVEVAEIGRAHV